MSNSNTQRVRVSSGFANAKGAQLISRGYAVVSGLTNPAFPSPPVDPASLKSALDSYSIALGEAVDGGKKAILERNRQREVVVKMLRMLAHYVQVMCNDDAATVLLSGFEPLISTRSAPQPVNPTSIRRIEGSCSGQLLVRVVSVPGAWSYELRYAPLSNGMLGSWTSQPITTIKTPTSCNGLTPGTNYAFQVRALGRLGFSDWSDSVTKICG